jgi:hypothetical protein
MSPPRTVAEFAAHGLRVHLTCGACKSTQAVALDVLDATFGPDFDLVAGHRQLSSQLYCPACGAPRPDVSLELRPMDQRDADPVSRVTRRRA